MKKQIALDFLDLRYLEITCPACESRVTLDMQGTQARPPHACSCCGAAFDRMAVGEPVQSFMDGYRVFTHKENAVKVRVIVEERE